MREWLPHLRPGDWGTLLLGLALAGASFPLLWRGGVADRAVVKRDGAVLAEFALNAARRFEVEGPIGRTVIEIAPGRARVAADPGLHQYCVKQGWLTRPNSIAICAPNHVSLQLTGKDSSFDSLSY